MGQVRKFIDAEGVFAGGILNHQIVRISEQPLTDTRIRIRLIAHRSKKYKNSDIQIVDTRDVEGADLDHYRLEDPVDTDWSSVNRRYRYSYTRFF